MINLLYVALGGALGAVLRYGFGRLALQLGGVGFPYGTLGVNIIGSLLMGLFIGLVVKNQAPHEAAHLFVAVGLLGGFTTFSSFSLDVVVLFQRGELWAAALYAGASVVLAIGALFLGLAWMR